LRISPRLAASPVSLGDFYLENSMKEIPLTQGRVAIVDDEDYEWLNQWKWFFMNNGYAATNRKGKPRKMLYMHREINKTPDGVETDHINHNKLDNRKCNLRNCTRTQNQVNIAYKTSERNPYRGVEKRCQKYRAHIFIDNKTVYLGTHKNAEDAARAYDVKAVEMWGEFAITNFGGNNEIIN